MIMEVTHSEDYGFDKETIKELKKEYLKYFEEKGFKETNFVDDSPEDLSTQFYAAISGQMEYCFLLNDNSQFKTKFKYYITETNPADDDDSGETD